jgi:hypothetical protein
LYNINKIKEGEGELREMGEGIPGGGKVKPRGRRWGMVGMGWFPDASTAKKHQN